MPGLLARIVRLTVALVGPADYVSITVSGAGQVPENDVCARRT
ncbi:hypothetical protein NKG94_37060 [Micromonospora sp. M12]